MFPATVGFLALVAIVFVFGVLSARNAARNAALHRGEERRKTVQSTDSPVGENGVRVNRENPATEMAGATGTEIYQPETTRRLERSDKKTATSSTPVIKVSKGAPPAPSGDIWLKTA